MEKVKNKYKFKNFILGFILSFNVVLICILVFLTGPTNKCSNNNFVVTKGDSLTDIANNLEKEGFIKNDKMFLVYVVLKNSRDIYAANYDLNCDMSLGEVVSSLKSGGKNSDEITITFKEGLNMKQIASVIAKNTNNSKEDVMTLANDEAYVDELISKYWFITGDVKNKDIYYDLEGYLFPESYNFMSKDVTVREIFDKMITTMGDRLDKYKSDIEKSNYSVHQILTMASIVELEGVDKDSRKDIAGVFYNRLKSKMSLGSDVTTYYGVGKPMTSDLSSSELLTINGYNTRASGMEGKLPVGPIDNPSLSSIKSVLFPSKHDYYYFVADKNGKVYLTPDYETHNKLINDLKGKGLWFEW